MKKYYSEILTLGYRLFEGEAPEDVTDDEYIVIGEVTGTEASNHSAVMVNASIQIGIYTKGVKYKSTKRANEIAGEVKQKIKPLQYSTLQADGIGIVTTNLDLSRLERPGKFAGIEYVNRILIFSHLINLN